MARYIMLRFDDDFEAERFIEDVTNHPHDDLLTPCQENRAHVTIAYVVPESVEADPEDDTSSIYPS